MVNILFILVEACRSQLCCVAQQSAKAGANCRARTTMAQNTALPLRLQEA